MTINYNTISKPSQPSYHGISRPSFHLLKQQSGRYFRLQSGYLLKLFELVWNTITRPN